MRLNIVLFILVFTSLSAKAQYSFSGHVDNKKWHANVYLSIIEDYRKITGIYSEQIISKVKTDSLGFFEFAGDQLENENKIYRIHVDNCSDEDLNENHFNGRCDDSKEIIFIAKDNDTIKLPFSFEKEMFCDIKSNNLKAASFTKIDSLKEEMKYAFNQFRSEANRKLNNKKWFKALQDYGLKLKEPLAELYIYSFLSDRSSDFHEYYLEDLKTNSYYDGLLNRLTEQYPNSTYTKQYRTELTSDKFIISKNSEDITFNWNYMLYIFLFISIILNIYFWQIFKKLKINKTKNPSDCLTKQEQNILALIQENKSNKEIADALFVSLSTVKTHVNNIFKKLNVQSREDIKNLNIK
ncbi:helix-turn-helix transcriptional regulator [Gaetbulibacter sp. M235]|uniref:helix-turn-helix domain-containing protein n=1 Tax=Gaetbulibacter sp. M235 TaxID=3126510 RepID=UPI00374F30AE